MASRNRLCVDESIKREIHQLMGPQYGITEREVIRKLLDLRQAVQAALDKPIGAPAIVQADSP